MKEHMYLCIDLKSFYASVECVERGLDPITTNLVVADPERTEKTICLAITPAMKKLGIKNRCRVFEIPKNVKYIMAEPRMKLYMEYSANIYGIYLKYISKEDIFVYSIDEAFLDVSEYQKMYGMSAEQIARMIMKDIMETTGITATCGIGTNLYLTKIALDITAKHSKDNIGYLDEEKYVSELWKHKPITDFWRIGRGTAKRLSSVGIFSMEDVAKANEDLLYRMFGVDAELLIDHAWGRESVTMADIKAYKSKTNSLSSGQVLPRDYSFEEGLLIVKEMTDELCLDLVDKNLATGDLTLMVGYSNVFEKKPTGGNQKIPIRTNSLGSIMESMICLYKSTTDRNVPIRRISIGFNNLSDELYEQYDFFSNPFQKEKDRKAQKAAIEIKKNFGKNAIMKGMNLEKSATMRERNKQIGGHKSGEIQD